MLSELQVYKNDPKGKKSKAISNNVAKKHKRDSDEESSLDNSESCKKMMFPGSMDEMSNTSMENSINSMENSIKRESLNYSTQSSPMSLPSLPSQDSSHQSDHHSSPHNCGGSAEKSPVPYPVAIFPARQQSAFDMSNPPNVITPSAPIDSRLHVRPPSVESPADEATKQLQCQHQQVEKEAILGINSSPTASNCSLDTLDMETSECDGEEDNSPNSQNGEAPPPNKVAPPSEPLNFDTKASYAPVTPLSLDLPTDLSTTAQPSCVRVSLGDDDPSRQTLNTPAPPIPQEDSAQQHTSPESINNQSAQVSPATLTKTFSSCPPATTSSAYSSTMAPCYPPNSTMPPNWFPQMAPGGSTNNWDQSQNQKEAMTQAFQMGQVFPFPMMAENPMMLSSMPGMQIPPCEPNNMYRDPYQPYMIGTFNNPYFDPVAMHNYQQTDPQKQAGISDM